MILRIELESRGLGSGLGSGLVLRDVVSPGLGTERCLREEYEKVGSRTRSV